MSALLNVYRAQFKTTIAIQLQYRALLIIYLLDAVLGPTIYVTVWRTVAREQGGEVGGYGVSEFAAYYIALMLVNHATFTWLMWEFEWRVRNGSFNPVLLRPIHPIHADVAQNVSYKLLTSAVMLPVAAGLTLAFRPSLHPSFWEVLAFVPALALAFCLRFAIEWTFALMAFWVTRVSAVNEFYYVALIFLSGQVAPLSLYPEPVRVVAAVLPFRWIISFPVELILGRLSPEEIATGFAVQLAWLAAAAVLLSLVWRAGVRRYSAVGA